LVTILTNAPAAFRVSSTSCKRGTLHAAVDKRDSICHRCDRNMHPLLALPHFRCVRSSGTAQSRTAAPCRQVYQVSEGVGSPIRPFPMPAWGSTPKPPVFLTRSLRTVRVTERQAWAPTCAGLRRCPSGLAGPVVSGNTCLATGERPTLLSSSSPT